MDQVSVIVLGVDEDIIKVYYHKGVQIREKDLIHEPLEGCWGVT